MSNNTDKTPSPVPKPKAPYQAPRLKKHGDLRALTGRKGGNRSDGGGQPKTRQGGPQG